MTATQGYFPKQIKLPSQLMTEVQSLKQSLAEKIQKGEIEINKQQNLSIKKDKSEKDEKILKNEEYRKRIRQLDSIKQQLSNKLKGIDAEQKQIKILTKKIEKQSHRSKLQKSVITEEEKQKISRIKRQQKQFEISIKKKIDDVISKINEDEKQKEIQKKFKNDMQRKQRVINLEKRRMKLKESREKNIQILQKSQLTIQPKSYTYLKNEMKEKHAQEERIRYAEMKLKQRKQKMKIDFQQIKEHSTEFKKNIQQHNQARLFEQKQNQIRKRAKTITYQSQFSKKIKQQKKLEIIQKLRIKNAKKQIRERITTFNDYLAQNFKPKKNQQSAFVPKKQTSPLQKLSQQEIHDRGNQYLQISKKKARKVSPDQKNNKSYEESLKQLQRLPTSSTQKYPNYLTELRKNKKKDTKSILQRVIKQKKISTRKVEEVIKWMQSKDQANNIGNGKNVVSKQLSAAFQKIQLLNSIYQNQQELI